VRLGEAERLAAVVFKRTGEPPVPRGQDYLPNFSSKNFAISSSASLVSGNWK
jgi:hypothetical protein